MVSEESLKLLKKEKEGSKKGGEKKKQQKKRTKTLMQELSDLFYIVVYSVCFI